ncbi:hypothetical protein FRY98_23040 [Paenibacillus faecis]|uniref:Uncharacterized protein n=1 Tax=Paenibacillus faecis TaxID=862114 RepID=A0A5D0CN87_9BACL|nr:hypothetical protein FRY98_23040 [Paenibacillus faecis]
MGFLPAFPKNKASKGRYFLANGQIRQNKAVLGPYPEGDQPPPHFSHPAPRIPTPHIHIPHPTSHIPHPTSHIPHPTSHIPHPTSRKKNPGRIPKNQPGFTHPLFSYSFTQIESR